MSSLEWMQAAVNVDFQLRVQAAINYVAVEIINEDDTVPGHDIRLLAARKMLNGYIAIDSFAKLVCVDSSMKTIIDASQVPTDPELLGAVERSLIIMAKAAI